MYEELRPLMFSLAYRMVGSVTEAEDIVQEAWVRLLGVDEEQIESPKAYATAVVTRLAIDHLRSARVRREAYVGPWLPEPLVDERAPDPAERAELAESLTMGVLVLLESLSPVERAVFLLREAFDYDYEQIAQMVGKSPDNCRQLAVRARRHVEEGKPRFEASARRRGDVGRRFIAAFEEGDVDRLVELLAPDVVLYGDGGGKTPAIRKPMHGRDRVGRTLGAFLRQGHQLGVTGELVTINGEPGALFRAPDGALIGAIALEVVDGQVQTVRSIVNPDKLAHLGPVADLPALLRSRSTRSA
jgi:RNA polymerase sigma-70 factor (ECF subfamily)